VLGWVRAGARAGVPGLLLRDRLFSPIRWSQMIDTAPITLAVPFFALVAAVRYDQTSGWVAGSTLGISLQ
jgi:uncharacterized membrane protein YjjP (DUF1212 family)